MAAAWRVPARCCARTGPWIVSLAGSLVPLAVLTYGVSLLATVAANVDDLGRLRLGAISRRRMGQALFGEAILLAVGLALCHRTAARRVRAGALGLVALLLLAVYLDAYHVEPNMLLVRRHRVDRAGGAAEATTLRILHVTDIQTPVIGTHEERALRAGLEYRPDLIVLTGAYVQDELGRPTEEQAKRDCTHGQRSACSTCGCPSVVSRGQPIRVFRLLRRAP